MELGAFSISLAVKDLAVSREFYEKLGFEVSAGDETSYLIMANGATLIGLFEGMFDQNILTFNPGLTNDKEQLEEFTDVRDLQATLEERGITPVEQVDAQSSGAGHIRLIDPDGNPILIDQFF